MSKEHMIKAIIEKSVKDIDIPFTAIMNNGKAVDLCTTPELLFSALSGADKRIGKLISNNRFLLKAYLVMCVTTGIGLGLYKGTKKELEVCQMKLEETESELEWYQNHEANMDE